MKAYATVVLIAVALTSCTGAKTKGRSLILPDPKLLDCNSPGCQHLWKDEPTAAIASYPKQITIDFKGSYAYGLTAKYDKLTSINNIKAALDKDYGQWAVPSLNAPPLMMWRVEPEAFTAQLTADDDGTPELIYVTLKPELR